MQKITRDGGNDVKPQDFIIATGRQESVRRFIELSAKEIGWEDPKVQNP